MSSGQALQANNCFACGPENPIGLKITFRIDDDDVCRAEFTPQKNHEGYPGMTHGGIVYSALDDVMANWLFLQGLRGHTARCDIRYRLPLAIGDTVHLEGRCTSRRGRRVQLSGLALSRESGKVVAETQGTFVIAK